MKMALKLVGATYVGKTAEGSVRATLLKRPRLGGVESTSVTAFSVSANKFQPTDGVENNL